MITENRESEYIKIWFKEATPSGKTAVYEVATKSGHWMGVIKWHPAWRRYTFHTVKDRIWDVTCMDFISDFLNELMKDHNDKYREVRFPTITPLMIVHEVATQPCVYKGKCNSTRCMPCAAKRFLKKNRTAPKADISKEKTE